MKPLVSRLPQRLWVVSALAVLILVAGIFQMPPREWRHARLGEKLSPEITAWRYREDAKSKWFAPKPWGLWIMSLQVERGVVTRESLMMRVGTRQRYIGIPIYTRDSEEPSA